MPLIQPKKSSVPISNHILDEGLYYLSKLKKFFDGPRRVLRQTHMPKTLPFYDIRMNPSNP